MSWMRRLDAPLDPILDQAAALGRREGVALLVRALVPRLTRPVDRGHALRLAARLGCAGDDDAGDDDASPAARLVETLARLHAQLQLNRVDPRCWNAAQRERVFDPDWLVRRCIGEALLAAAAHRAWRAAAARLRDAGEDVSALAWSALTGTRPGGTRFSAAG